MRFLEIRNDDVLQIHLNPYSKAQRRALREKSFFDWFLEADKIFEEYNYPCTLAVLSEGIDIYPEWVQYIKDNLSRYKIELHGSCHQPYSKLDEKTGEKDLSQAIEKIEKTFNIKITTWYVPLGRKFIPEWGERVCERMGIKCDIPTMKILPFTWKMKPLRTHINFHYWYKDQVEQINQIVKEICEK